MSLATMLQLCSTVWLCWSSKHSLRCSHHPVYARWAQWHWTLKYLSIPYNIHVYDKNNSHTKTAGMQGCFTYYLTSRHCRPSRWLLDQGVVILLSLSMHILDPLQHSIFGIVLSLTTHLGPLTKRQMFSFCWSELIVSTRLHKVWVITLVSSSLTPARDRLQEELNGDPDRVETAGSTVVVR